jgi:threonine dehydratase
VPRGSAPADTVQVMSGLVSLADVIEAEERVAPVIRPTPVEQSHAISELVGRPVLFKPEHRQRTGSFKIRGAYNHIARLPPHGEVVAASAGNHAQGVALAASKCGLAATIFMPENAPLPKVAATRGYGATVRLEGANVDASMAAASEHVARHGGHLVPPFDDPLVIAGQGTVGLEIAREAPEATVVVVPVGGGGLLAGVAAALAACRPEIRVIGVEAAGAAAMRAAMDAGQRTTLASVNTMADGIANRTVSELTLAHVQAFVDDVIMVSEEEISRAVLLSLERVKAVVEPAGAVGLAALLSGRIPGDGPAVTILSGGNVDPLLLIRLIDHGLSAAGRYLLLRIILDDRPGSLAELTTEVARLGLNVLEVTHRRAGVTLGLRQVEVLLTLETRDPTHRQEVVDALTAAHFRVELLG